MYLLDYILPQVAKLSHALQTNHLDLSLISSLVDTNLNLLDDAILPSANWVLQLQDAREELKAATVIEVTHVYALFKKEWASLLLDSTAFSIFDPKKVSGLSTHELPLYGESSLHTLIGQFGRDSPANHWKELNLRR